MKTYTLTSSFRGRIALALIGVFGIVLTARTAPTDIHNEPLAEPASNIKPNVMFILDNSGSMAWDYSPDWIYYDQTTNGATYVCFDNKDEDNAITITPPSASYSTASLKRCQLGDPPYMTSDFNKQYYDPKIFYKPGVNHDGTEKPSQNAANTSNWTSVRTDMFNVQNRDQLGNSVNYTNLATGYPDRVWCTAKSDSASGPNCVKNSAYSYPSDTYGYGETSGGNIKYVTGAPYYYIITPTEYCTTPDLITCNVQAGPDASYPHAAYARWCTNSSFSDCRGKRYGTYLYPKVMGTVTGSLGSPAVAATGSITIGNSGSDASVNISSIVINGVNIMNPAASGSYGNGVSASGGVITASTGTNSSGERSSVATAIAAAINSYASTPDYSATSAGSTVTITAGTTGPWPNGFPITVNSTAVGVTAATATLTVTSVANPSSISSITVNGINIIGGTVSCNYTNNGTNRGTCATNIRNAIGTSMGVPYVSSPDYSATRSGAVVTISAPVSLGASANGWVVVETGSVGTTTTNMTGGVTSGTMPATTVAMANGADAVPAAAPTRVNVGAFSRVNIVFGGTYPKYTDRTDCAGLSECTYEEEMTNFSNWYTYYRTRMQMMKSAAGRAFTPIDDTFRVGFISHNPGDPVSSLEYLKINDFTSGTGNHRDLWYSKFYSQSASGGTPLREALSRVGRLFAGKTDEINDGIPAADNPIQYTCQPNFAILSTDGYWNGNAGVKLNGTSPMGDEDHVDAEPSLQSDGRYDFYGTAGTLADVALYYWANDLRPDLLDTLKTSQRDKANWQHMTTFTLGLGLDGELSYVKNYDDSSVTTGDFYAIKQGTKHWPAPVANLPSALDDLWHAAVNGRGKFFSATNPTTLAQGLTDTLAALQAVTGAGAAAATSNLQPVAGDNFAFTAQYTTVDWIGDVKARTLDLNTGVVSSVALWSAQPLLDAKAYADRTIYTFDATDPIATGNQLKHFCWPASGGTNCSDGSGLTVTEQGYFNPSLLAQYAGWTPGQQGAATGQMVVDFLRGDTANETTGGTAVSDLFRARPSVLGDIISAQPAYVKASPFAYTDTGYGDFKQCTAGTTTVTCPTGDFPTPSVARRGTVYVPANDGMLHAFETDVNNNPYYQTAGIGTPETSDDAFTGNNAGNGEERWAYIPSFILPELRHLADIPYAHRYYTDGKPVVGDICITAPCAGLSDWRTVLVAGMSGGGRGYYALDITNPLAPKALWEFKVSSTCLTDAQANAGTASADCHLGLTYGNALITKRRIDGKWVVIVASGLNNYNPGDGRGYLYILDAYTGKILRRITTGVGSGGTALAGYTDADPSGLNKINGWSDNGLMDNTSLAIYGGDLKGNLWKFELDDSKADYLTAIKLAELKDASNVAQPITTKPELAYVSGYRVVYVGTGLFLGLSDKSTTQTQTIYAIRDDQTSTTITAPRTELVQQTIGVGAIANQRTSTSSNAVNWTSSKGWYIDLPDPGERVNVDPVLQLGALIVASNVPTTDPCLAGGYAWLNSLDITSGLAIPMSIGTIASQKIASSLVVGINVVELPGGKIKTIVTTADNLQTTVDTEPPPPPFSGKRVSWREIVVEQ